MFYGVNENERRTQLRLFPSRRYTAAYYGETRISLSLSTRRPSVRYIFIEDLSRQHWMGRVRKMCKLGSRTVTRTLPGAKETVIERTIIYRMF